jgi:seryl-tRNA synthetase
MIDINLIRNNPELVKENIKKKFQDSKLVLVDEVIELDKKNRALKQEGDDLRANRNKLSAEVGKFMKEKNFEEAEKIKAQVKANAERITQIEEAKKTIEVEMEEQVEARKILDEKQGLIKVRQDEQDAIVKSLSGDINELKRQERIEMY